MENSLDWIDQQSDSFIELLMSWSAINSGTFNLEGLASMHDELFRLFSPLADHSESIELEDRTEISDGGQEVSISHGRMLCFQKRPDADFKVLLCGHMDTVFPKESHFQTPQWQADGVIHGPGVADMKGGLLTIYLALKALEESDVAKDFGWEVMINPDEETGSIASAPFIAESARRNHVGLVYEPALADGTLAGARKGSGNFSLLVKGKSAHAGREFDKGRNAIAALAKAMQMLDTLNGQKEGATINLGRISGGGALNAVADTAVCHFNMRSKRPEDAKWLNEQVANIVANIGQIDGITASIHGTFNRQPKIISPEIAQMFEWLREVGSNLGVDIKSTATGGCCDGNNLAAEGLPNIDTLGVRGGLIHTDQEFMIADSLAERARLSYLFIRKLVAQKDVLAKLKSQQLETQVNS